MYPFTQSLIIVLALSSDDFRHDSSYMYDFYPLDDINKLSCCAAMCEENLFLNEYFKGLAALVRFQRSRRLLGVCYIVVKVSITILKENLRTFTSPLSKVN